MKRKVLVVGTHRNTRGGITSVIKSHENSQLWTDWNCKWIPTYIDRSVVFKIMFFFRGLFLFLINLPSANLVHIHLSEPTSALRKSIFFRIAKIFRKKIILHFHAFSPDSTIFGKRKELYSKLFNSANLVIVLSSFWKTQVDKILTNSAKVVVVFNPCPVVKQTGIIEKQKFVLFAGTLNERKGYSDLIKAFALIAGKFPDWKLVFAGNGEIGTATELSKSLGILSQVDFKGWVSGPEKERLFAEASVFCLPSYAEGFPMAVLDAWAFGLPVIATPVGGLPDIVVHGENAMIFNPGNIEELKVNLEILLSDDLFRKKLRVSSLKLSNEIFDIKVIAHQIDELYSKLV